MAAGSAYAAAAQRVQYAIDYNRVTKLCLLTLSVLLTDDTLLQHAELYRLSVPSAYDLKMLRSWINMPECGDRFLRAHEARAFDSPDLISLRGKVRDPFTTWIDEKITPRFHHLVGHLFKVQFSQAQLRLQVRCGLPMKTENY